LRVVDECRSWHFEADFAAGILEPEAIFGNFNGAERSANHFNLVLFENAAFGEFDRKVESGLTADCRQKRIWLFASENFVEIFLGERLDVRAVSQLRVGHDRGGIGIDEHNFVALGAQRLACLCAGIVKTRRLAQ